MLASIHPVRLALSIAALFLLAACSGGDPSAPTNRPSASSSAAASSSIDLPAPLGTLTSFEVDDGGSPRRYDVYAPPDADPGEPLPTVVVLPGTNVALESLRATTEFDLLADTEGFLVVYVDAGVDGFDGRLCCGGTDRDVEFVRSVLAAVDEQWPVDPRRVYATGFSAGAAMSYKLAVRAPDVFAAIAPVSGGFFPDPRVAAPEAVVPAGALSVVAFAGTADSGFADYVGGVQLWRRGADCAPATEAEVDSVVGVQRSVAQCAGGSAVELYTVTDMGHSWPGGAGEVGFGDRASGLRATQVIWDFFATHSRP